jgi:hypothetical protein
MIVGIQCGERTVEGDARPLIPGLDERQAWEVWSPSGRVYRVALSWCLGWECTCPDWTHRLRAGRTAGPDEPCKHLAAIQRLIAEKWNAPVPRLGPA